MIKKVHATLKFLVAIYCALLSNTGFSQVISTVAGNGTSAYDGDGVQATATGLYFPMGVTLDRDGNLYIADQVNGSIRKVNSLGIISTIAGKGKRGYSGDGGPATAAELAHSGGILIDTAGTIYIADKNNNRVRKIDHSGIISTLAGTGNRGFSGDGGQAAKAELFAPAGLALDAAGNLYFSDSGNNRIRKISTSGIISTVAGNGKWGIYSGDGGPAIAADLWDPSGIAFDPAGNLYIADSGNWRIRKVNKRGIISTIAGNGIRGYSGDGGQATAAKLGTAIGIAFDAAGNLYFSDDMNNRIRKINSQGIITTIVGKGTQGHSGDGKEAITAELYEPGGIAFDAFGNLYIADVGNYCIRKVSNVAVVNK